MNKSGNNNRSVRNTKKRLLDGLLSLLREQSISSISVRELCALVDVNRGTFYFHYSDIYDMIHKVEEEFFREFDDIIDQFPGEILKDGSPLSLLEKVFYICSENREFCEIMLGPNGDSAFVGKIKIIVDEKCSKAWENVAGPNLNLTEYEFFNAFIINGCIGLLEKWLKNGCKQSPEQMAAFAANIVIPGVKNSLRA